MIKVTFILPHEQLLTSNFNLLEELPGLILSALTVDRFGRKLSMAVMFFICCIFLLPLVVHQSRTLTTVLLFGARICIAETFTVVYIYAPEVNQGSRTFHLSQVLVIL